MRMIAPSPVGQSAPTPGQARPRRAVDADTNAPITRQCTAAIAAPAAQNRRPECQCRSGEGAYRARRSWSRRASRRRTAQRDGGLQLDALAAVLLGLVFDRTCGCEVAPVGEPLGEGLGELAQLRAGHGVGGIGGCVAGGAIARVEGVDEFVDVDGPADVPGGPGVDGADVPVDVAEQSLVDAGERGGCGLLAELSGLLVHVIDEGFDVPALSSLISRIPA